MALNLFDGAQLVISLQVCRVDGVVHADLVDVTVPARLAVYELVLLDAPHEVREGRVLFEHLEQEGAADTDGGC
ncbi:MAG TPA: hypothetical protein VM490_05615, partial [Armatimonadaceae bacterium]|nr:hypothetical protein [Armatimonadaceae bacterium]